jgi:hypothetical protein
MLADVQTHVELNRFSRRNGSTSAGFRTIGTSEKT